MVGEDVKEGKREGGRGERVKYGQRSYGGEGWIERGGGHVRGRQMGRRGRRRGRGEERKWVGESGVRGRGKEGGGRGETVR